MSDFILTAGDIVTFLPNFPPATVTVCPGVLMGSGKAKCGGKQICVDGDEKQVEIPGCPYVSGAFTIPGVGTLKIQELGQDQLATKTKCGGSKVMLKGTMFIAVFEVQTPAQQPPSPPPTPPKPDPTPKYTGQGMFSTTNLKWKAT